MAPVFLVFGRAYCPTCDVTRRLMRDPEAEDIRCATCGGPVEMVSDPLPPETPLTAAAGVPVIDPETRTATIRSSQVAFVGTEHPDAVAIEKALRR